MNNKICVAVFLGQLLSAFGVLGENSTEEVKNQLLLKSLSSSNGHKTESAPGGQDSSNKFTITDFLSLDEGPIVHQITSENNRIVDVSQLSSITEDGQLVRDIRLCQKQRKDEILARASELKQNSTGPTKEVNGSSSSLTYFNIIQNMGTVVNRKSSNARTAGTIRSKVTNFAAKDVMQLDPNYQRQVQVYQKLLSLALKHINKANHEDKPRVQNKVRNIKKNSESATKIDESSVKTMQDNRQPEEAGEVVGNSEGSSTNANAKLFSQNGSKVPNNAAIDLNPLGGNARQQVLLYKQILKLALEHINIVTTNDGPSHQTDFRSDKAINKRYIDTLASGLIGKK